MKLTNSDQSIDIPIRQKYSDRYPGLDGWRGISILLVLAAHLLPLGPKFLQLNFTVGILAMSLFFTLSGFLITSFLIKKQNIVDFLLRRFFRIIPLAWLYILIVLTLLQSQGKTYFAHLFFYANWPPMQFTHATAHFWSLCVEVQFYLAIALLVALWKDKGLMLIPALCLGVTFYRMSNGVHVAMETYYRVDEILAGGILSLAYYNKLGKYPKLISTKANQYLLILLLFASCHPATGFLNYLRPYLAAILVGSTLFSNQNKVISSILNHKILLYLASISYAVYIIHQGLIYTWLGEGDILAKYLKRPLLLIVLFPLAHLSTFYYEEKCIAWGKSLSIKLQRFRESNHAV